MKRGDDIERTLTAAGNIRNAPVTRLIGPENEVYDLRKPKNPFLSVGRSPERDVVIQASYQAVSEYQCDLQFYGNRWLVTHRIGATNPTVINGVEIMKAWLKLGQELRLGDKEFLAYAGDEHLRGARATQALIDEGSYAAAARALGENANVTTVTRLVKKHQQLWAGTVASPIDDTGAVRHVLPREKS